MNEIGLTAGSLIEYLKTLPEDTMIYVLDIPLEDKSKYAPISADIVTTVSFYYDEQGNPRIDFWERKK